MANNPHFSDKSFGSDNFVSVNYQVRFYIQSTNSVENRLGISSPANVLSGKEEGDKSDWNKGPSLIFRLPDHVYAVLKNKKEEKIMYDSPSVRNITRPPLTREPKPEN